MADSKITQLTVGTPVAGDKLVAALSDGSDNIQFDFEILSGLISRTYAAANTDIGNTALVPGKLYHITDKDLIITATSSTTFGLQGYGRFDIPDYTVNSVWVSLAGGGVFGVNDKAIYNGIVWNNTTGTNTNTAPPSDGANWTQVVVDIANYNEDWDYIHYEFTPDQVLLRKDSRGNQVSASSTFIGANNPIAGFQWGNVNVRGNAFLESDPNLINQAGFFRDNIFTGASSTGTLDENFTGNFSDNTASNGSVINMVSGTTATIIQCVFDNQATIVFNNQINVLLACNFSADLSASGDIGAHTNKRHESEKSTLELSIDFSESIFDFPTATTLEITGDFTTIYNSGDTIQILGSTTNDGTYILTAGPVFAAGVTTLTAAAAGWTVEAGVGDVTGQVIDLSTSGQFIGIFKITSPSPTVTITEILNAPTNFRFELYPDDLMTYTLTHVGVGAATANQIVLESGVNLPLVGRAARANSDFIELDKTGTYLRQINASTLV